jgi:hypothetical protein
MKGDKNIQLNSIFQKPALEQNVFHRRDLNVSDTWGKNRQEFDILIPGTAPNTFMSSFFRK